MNSSSSPGYKNTKIGEIPQNWDIVKLGDVIKKVKQIDPRKHPERIFSYIDVSGISQETNEIVALKKYIGKNAPHRARKPLNENDIIFATVRPYLKRVAIVPNYLDGQIGSTAFAIIRCIDGITDYRYVLYYLLTDRIITILKAQQRGSNYPAVSDKDLYNLKIPLPPFSEQQQIADILSTVDDAIKKTDDIIAKTQELKKGLMQRLLTKGIGHTRFKKTEIGEIPEKWNISPLKSKISLSSGKFNPTKNLSDNYKYPVYGGNGLTGYFHDYMTSYPTIVIGRVGEYCGSIHLAQAKSWVTDNAIYIKKLVSDIELPYLYYYLITTKLRRYADTTGQPKLTQNIIYRLIVPIPSIEEQQKISNILLTIDKKIEIEEQRKKKTVELKRGLMQLLLTGKVRVKVGRNA